MSGGSGDVRVLHVDDEPEFAELAAEYLDHVAAEFEVVTVHSADAALAALDGGSFDAVVSDFDMPGTDGLELLEAVRERDPQMPFVLFTGKGSEEVASDAISAGVTDYIQKEAGADQYAVLANRVRNAVEAREAERGLEVARGRYQALLENSDDAIARIEMVDDVAVVRDLNPAFDALFVPEGESGLGRDIDELVAEGDRVEEARGVTERLLDGRPRRGEVVRDTVDGPRDFLWQGVPIVAADDEPGMHTGYAIYTEISELKGRERTLARLVERLNGLIGATSPDEVAETAVDIAGEVLGASLAGVHLLSDDGERLAAAALLDTVHERLGAIEAYDRGGDGPAAVVWEAFDRDEPTYIEDVRELEMGPSVTPARTIMIVPLDDHGVLILSSTEPDALDGTDRAHAELLGQAVTSVLNRVAREASLSEHGRRMERLHEVAQELISADSPGAIAELVVATAQDTLGYPITVVRYLDEAAGGLAVAAETPEITEIFDDRPVFTADGGSLNWRAFQAGEPTVYDDISAHPEAVDADTEVRSLMVIPMGEHGTVSFGDTDSRVFDEGDVQLAQLLVTTAELAMTRLDRERELVAQRDELDRQNQRLDEFASYLSHDLRNPLSVAKGRVALAREAADSPDLASASGALERMDAMIEELLRAAREGETVTAREPVSVGELVPGCWDAVGTEEGSVVVVGDAVVNADRERLRRVLENLFRNAVEHAGPAVTVRVGPLDGGLFVEDDGPGVPAADRELVFEPGYSTAQGGTGLGLVIARNVVEAHGGTLELTKGEAGGARFELRGLD